MRRERVLLKDKVVKKLLNSENPTCREYLVRLISASTGISVKLLRNNIELITPNINSNSNYVNSVSDVMVKDNENYYNIEINYNNVPIAIVKNNIYMYNSILRQVHKSDDYKNVKGVIQININNYDLFSKGEFVYDSMMIEKKHHIVRDNMLRVIDINLDFLSNIDYNKIKKGNEYNLEKLLYFFVCNDKKLLDNIYNGNGLMRDISKIFNIDIEDLDKQLYYDYDEYMKEVSYEQGEIDATLKRNKEKQKAEKYITNKNLSNIVVFRRMLPEAHIPFSYYRQAHIFFNDGNYYFAYINYFMMLEFCFADGHFHKQAVTNNFCKSELLKLCVLSTLNMLKNDKKADNYKWLYEECKSRQKKVDFEGVVYILIEYRGLLSHATERSKKYLFDNNKLRPIALIISIICFLLCGYMQIFCCSSEESKKRLIKENIDNLEKVKKDEI